MSSSLFPCEGGAQQDDPGFTDAIHLQMRVPERLSMGPGPHGDEERPRPDDPRPSYSMHIPDRLALIDIPDLSPRPMFSPAPRQVPRAHPREMWEGPPGGWGREAHPREPVQSPLRRSYSDHSFGKTPPVTPSQSKQPLLAPPLRSAGGPSHRGDPLASPGILSPQSMLQAARELSQQASKRLLQSVSNKCASRFGFAEGPTASSEARKSVVSWCSITPPRPLSGPQESWAGPEDEGEAVEFIVLRRQVVKMSRRLAGLEKQNAERRQTELVLFSLLFSACLLNGWLWMRR